jgi:hypothetical protein
MQGRGLIAARIKPGKPRTGKPGKGPAASFSERIEVPGRRALFKLIEWAPDSFHLLRSSRKIGTAAEEGGAWSARFRFDDRDWKGKADSAPALIRLVGTFMLASEARDAAAAPAQKSKGRLSAEERISLKFLERAQKVRADRFDDLIAECRKRIAPA